METVRCYTKKEIRNIQKRTLKRACYYLLKDLMVYIVGGIMLLIPYAIVIFKLFLGY